jgi:hypothetical protein
LLLNSFSASSEADCEGYTTSIRVDRNIQSKKFRSELAVHFPPASVSLVKE